MLTDTVTEVMVAAPGVVIVPVTVVAAVLTTSGVVGVNRDTVVSRVILVSNVLTFGGRELSVAATEMVLTPGIRVTGALNAPFAASVALTGVPLLTATVTLLTAFRAGAVAVPVMVVAAALTSDGVVTLIAVAIVSRVMLEMTVLSVGGSELSVAVMLMVLTPAASVTGALKVPSALTVAAIGAPLFTVTATLCIIASAGAVAEPVIVVAAVLIRAGLVIVIDETVGSKVVTSDVDTLLPAGLAGEVTGFPAASVIVPLMAATFRDCPTGVFCPAATV